MKKILLCILACVFVFALSACSQPTMSDEEILERAEEILEAQGKTIVDIDEVSSNQSDEFQDTVEDIWDSMFEETQSSASESTEEPELGSRKNPAQIGDLIIVETYDSIVEITLTEVIRGEQALEIAKDSNKYNEVADGKEIIMAKFKIKNIQDISGEDESYYASQIQFSYADSSFTKTTSWASVAGLEEELQAELYEGAETEGYVCFEANEGEPSPYAIFEDCAWFNISGD